MPSVIAMYLAHHKAYPDEKGTERSAQQRSKKHPLQITRRIPMRRELKGRDSCKRPPGSPIRITRRIPMRRELKVYNNEHV